MLRARIKKVSYGLPKIQADKDAGTVEAQGRWLSQDRYRT